MSIENTVAALNAIEHNDSAISIDYDMWARKWHIHMKLERFVELFDEWHSTEHSDEWIRFSMDVDGIDVFALQRKEA